MNTKTVFQVQEINVKEEFAKRSLPWSEEIFKISGSHAEALQDA